MISHRRRLAIGFGAAALLTVGTATTGAYAHDGTTTTPKVVSRNPSGTTPKTTDVRWSNRGDYDRITFEFKGNAPGYDVRYVTKPTTCGSGSAVHLNTAAYLQVRIFPATAHAYDTTIARPNLPTLKKIKKTCDFEGVTTWMLGLDEKETFHVSTLYNPTRIYVDMGH